MNLTKKHNKNNKLITTFICIFIAVSLPSCGKVVQTRGYVTEFSRFGEIQIGKTSKEETLRLLGSPSTKSSFDNERWYYIGTKVKEAAFATPELVDQDVVLIAFDSNGIVEKIERTSSTQNNRNIIFADESTPTEGHEIGVVEQLLGNLGRFNAAK